MAEESASPRAAAEELNASNPVVAVAHRHARIDGPIFYTTEAGVRLRVRRVSPYLIAQVQGRIADPPIPMGYNAEKEREEPNPMDAGYLKAMAQARMDRIVAGADASIMFGLELVDGLPEDASWAGRLALLGINVDKDDPLAMEFAYKKYVAIGAGDMRQISELLRSGPTAEEVTAAEARF